MTAMSPPLVPQAHYPSDPPPPHGDDPSSPASAKIQQQQQGHGRGQPRESVPASPIHERQRGYPLHDINASPQQQGYQSPAQQTRGGSAAAYQKQLPQFSGNYGARITSLQSNDSRDLSTPPGLLLNRPSVAHRNDPAFKDPLPSPSFMLKHVVQANSIPQPQTAVISSGDSNRSTSSDFCADGRTESPISTALSATTRTPAKVYPQLQHHNPQFEDSPNSSNPSFNDSRMTPNTGGSTSPTSDTGPYSQPAGGQLLAPQAAYRRNSRPTSLALDSRGRSPGAEPRLRAVSGHSYISRRSSYMDLTQPEHTQEVHHRPVSSFDNSHLQTQVGGFASLMSSKQTLEMYRANAKKTQDPGLQYDLAVFMIQLAQQQPAEGTRTPGSPSQRKNSATSDPATPNGTAPTTTRKELLKEARETLERIQSKLPQAQYYLADAYSSGLFSKGREENDKAFPLFVAASKHGHAEAGYRAALCYEFGWGCRKDPLKAVPFFRHAASKSHPGAMTRLGIACLRSDLGLHDHCREGLKWLKRATEVADEQYPSAPYELGLLHETGYGENVLPDPAYSAQLFTKAAELGHAEANFRMGDAYEHGKLECPRDPALSVHFYVVAARHGHPLAMMALCAWYLVGAEPVLEKNEGEAYAWAKQASEYGLSKAEYAIGYFTEMGIGCRRDPLEANVWYVKAASHGDERAVVRLKVINEAAGGGRGKKGKKLGKDKEKNGKEGKELKEKDRKEEGKKLEKEGSGKGDCCIM